MTSRDFCYWLQGYMEIATVGASNMPSKAVMTEKQVEIIQKHLNLVFKHEIDPSFGDEDKQNTLNHLHSNNDGPFIVRC